MSDTTPADGEQLFDTGSDEVAEDATDSDGTKGDSEENADEKPEDEQDGLNLEKDKPEPKDERVSQIKAAQKRIDDGKVTVEQFLKEHPAQGWLKDYLKPKGQEPDHKAIAREIAKEAIEEERLNAKFSNLKEALEEQGLPKEKKRLLEEKFQAYRKRGLSKLDALETAVEVANIDLSGVSELKRRMKVPRPSARSGGETDFDRDYAEVHKEVPEAKRQEYLKKLVK